MSLRWLKLHPKPRRSFIFPHLSELFCIPFNARKKNKMRGRGKKEGKLW